MTGNIPSFYIPGFGILQVPILLCPHGISEGQNLISGLYAGNYKPGYGSVSEAVARPNPFPLVQTHHFWGSCNPGPSLPSSLSRSDQQSVLHKRVFTVVFSQPLLPALFRPPPLPPGKLGGQDSFESIESYDSCDRLTQSWSSQSSFNSLQRVPSYDSFDSEDYPAALPNHKPKGTFKDYVRDRADLNKDKPVIPAAALAGYTGRHPAPVQVAICMLLWARSSVRHRDPRAPSFLFVQSSCLSRVFCLKPCCLGKTVNFWKPVVSSYLKGSFLRVGENLTFELLPYLGKGPVTTESFWKLPHGWYWGTFALGRPFQI